MPEGTRTSAAARTAFLRWAGLVGTLLAVVVLFLVLNPPGGRGAVSAVEVETPAGTLPEIGSPAPGFSATTTTGEQVALDDLAGRPVWLVVNATWCTSCRAEVPDIQRVADSAGWDRVEIVSVYLGEDEATVAGFADRLGLTYRHVPDPGSVISAAYSVPGVPVHYFIDGEGVLQAIEIGSLGMERIEEELRALAG